MYIARLEKGYLSGLSVSWFIQGSTHKSSQHMNGRFWFIRSPKSSLYREVHTKVVNTWTDVSDSFGLPNPNNVKGVS